MTAAARADGIAVLGGSFNPPHGTHRRIAAAAFAHLPISELRVLPAGDHPHKRHRDMAPAAHRLAMCRLLFADLPHVVVDDREVRREGPSFTVDTLAELQREHPGRQLFLLVGSDNTPLLPTWRDHHRILALATVVTFPRADAPLDAAALHRVDLSAREREDLLAHVLPMAADAVSATAIRARLRAGERDLPELAPAVEGYLRTHHLYGT